MKDGLGAAGSIIQDCGETLRGLFIGQPVVILVEKGTKVFIEHGHEFTADAGGIAVLCGNTRIDAVNTSAEDDVYRARWIAFHDDVLKEYEKKQSSEGDEVVYVAEDVGSHFRESFDACWRLFTEDADIPESIKKHRMAELLYWLTEMGCFSLFKKESGISVRVRSVIEQDIARKWNSADICRELGMSESTLRRKLLINGETIAGIVQDVRMVSAMNLLQCTDMSITEIAIAVGYDSPSRFAGRFRTRFGFPPSSIRGHRR